jgi:N-acetylglucosaminyl-diphospho-decaprenol L-rhamnosyltransferase
VSGPVCAIVVVTYNSAAEIARCLAALSAQAGVSPTLHVIDNASADGTAEVVRAHRPAVDLVVNPGNVGFAAAVNQGLDRVDPATPWVVLANPDTVAAPGVLAACVAYLEAHPDVAVAGPRLVHPDGSLHRSCHGFMDLAGLLGEALLLDRVWPASRLGALHRRDFAHDRVARVDWIQGAFLVVRAAAIARVGGLDPAFFMYGEEMDWMLRMRRAGEGVVFLPGPDVMHVGGASSRPIAGPMFVELLKSRLRFMRKHRGPRAGAAAAALLALGVGLRFACWELGGLLSAGRPPAQRELVRLRRVMFRAGMGWIVRGFPLDAPRIARGAA